MSMILGGARRSAQGASRTTTVVLAVVSDRRRAPGQLALTEKSLNVNVAGTLFVETSSTP